MTLSPAILRVLKLINMSDTRFYPTQAENAQSGKRTWLKHLHKVDYTLCPTRHEVSTVTLSQMYNQGLIKFFHKYRGSTPNEAWYHVYVISALGLAALQKLTPSELAQIGY